MRQFFPAVVLAVVLSFPAAGMAAAQDANSDQPHLLSVSGEATIRAQPDMALITLGVVTQATAAHDALAENSTSMTRIIDALKASGMESRDLQTSGFSVQPVYSQPPRDYDPSQPFEPKIIGYSVSNNLTLRIRDLDKVGSLLDQVVTLGANSISGPTFTVSNPAPLEDQARRAAVKDALRKGALYAEAADVALGAVFRIEGGYVQPPQPMAAGVSYRMEAQAAPPVPIEGGELTFQSQVNVSWVIDE